MLSKKRLILFWLEEKEDWETDTLEYFIHLRFSGTMKPLIVIQIRNYLKGVAHTQTRKKTIALFEGTQFEQLFGSTTHILLEEAHDEPTNKSFVLKIKVAKKPDYKLFQRMRKKARSNEINYTNLLTKQHHNQLKHRAIFHDYAFVKPLSHEERRWFINTETDEHSKE
jgi:hypothetical protein